MFKDTKDKKVLAQELAELTYNVFETAQGKKLLEYWIENNLMAPVAHPNYSESYARFIEGQNNFIRSIITAIDCHKNPDKYNGTKTQEVTTNV